MNPSITYSFGLTRSWPLGLGGGGGGPLLREHVAEAHRLRARVDQVQNFLRGQNLGSEVTADLAGGAALLRLFSPPIVARGRWGVPGWRLRVTHPRTPHLLHIKLPRRDIKPRKRFQFSVRIGALDRASNFSRQNRAKD